MSKTYYSRNDLHFIGWKTLSKLTGVRPKNIRQERSGIQFREGKYTTDDEREIKALDIYINGMNDILDCDFTKSDKKEEFMTEIDRKEQELYKPEQKSKDKMLKKLRDLI
jgi:hypothetical protein